MADGPRALLTDTEKRAVRGDDEEMTDATRRNMLNRVEKKLKKLRKDAELLRKHRPEYAEELALAAGELSTDERVERLEDEVAELRERVAELEEKDADETGQEAGDG